MSDSVTTGAAARASRFRTESGAAASAGSPAPAGSSRCRSRQRCSGRTRHSTPTCSASPNPASPNPVSANPPSPGPASPSLLLLVSLSLVAALVHFSHQSSLFENNNHFSHLSAVEREMSFRTEMGFYFNFYKKLAAESHHSLPQALDSITNDNITEYPNTINGLNRFNILPEVILGVSFRVFTRFINSWGIQMKRCFVVSRGHPDDQVECCEGLADHFYFYLTAVFGWNSLVPVLILLSGCRLSGNILGGLLSVAAFAYNHGQATRVQWTPPLRESFAYPIYLALHYYLTSTIDSPPTKPVILISLVTLLILTWQFSQFILLTQLIALYLTLKLRLQRDYLRLLFRCHLCAIVLSTVFMFFNYSLITSLYCCFTIAYLLADLLLNKQPDQSKFNSMMKHMALHMFVVAGLTVILKVVLTFVFNQTDDSHVWMLFYSKIAGILPITDYKDFHTLLYTCAPEFDFISQSDIKSLTRTLLLPLSLIITVIMVIKSWPNRRSIQLNAVQSAIFTAMAVLVMRLKLLLVPQLCIIISLWCCGERLTRKRIGLFALLISLMSIEGIWNIREQRNIIGEYFNEPLEQLINWVNSSTHRHSVFAGSMPTMANLMLSTRRPIVNHPHYESSVIRQRTYIIYQLYREELLLLFKWKKSRLPLERHLESRRLPIRSNQLHTRQTVNMPSTFYSSESVI